MKTHLMRAAAALPVLGGLYVIMLIFAAGRLVIGTGTLVVFSFAVYIFWWSTRGSSYRYLFPGLLGITLFVVLPLVYTVRIGFTNRSSANLLGHERVTELLLAERHRLEGAAYAMSMYRDGERYRLVFEAQEMEGAGEGSDGPDGDEAGGEDPGDDWDDFEGDGGDGAATDDADDEGATDDAGAEAGDDDWADFEGGDDGDDGGEAGGEDAGAAGDDAGGDEWADFEGADPEQGGDSEQAAGPGFVTAAIALDDTTPDVIEVKPLAESGFQPRSDEELGFGDINRNKEFLNRITVRFPDGTEAVADTTDLEQFVLEKLKYSRNDDGTLSDTVTGQIITADFDTGFYRTAEGEPVIPGFQVDIGFDHYVNIFTNEGLRQPFIQIFIWTILFSGLTVLFTLIVGFLLSELMSWEALRFRGVYQIFLFLPYAVPGFISILVFKGLFNENSGEINLILSNLLGIKPGWFTDPFLAKVMILIVNTWLGYPYIMLLCMGLRKSIPGDLYEASSVEGASAWDNIVNITWPLIRKPIMPLLVSSFAFNFNNFVLIYLLTAGRPDIIGTQYPAGETDILVSYTYRLAFQDAGKQFGLAGAIATVIFSMVAVLSVVNLKLTRVQANEVER